MQFIKKYFAEKKAKKAKLHEKELSLTEAQKTIKETLAILEKRLEQHGKELTKQYSRHTNPCAEIIGPARVLPRGKVLTYDRHGRRYGEKTVSKVLLSPPSNLTGLTKLEHGKVHHTKSTGMTKEYLDSLLRACR